MHTRVALMLAILAFFLAIAVLAEPAAAQGAPMAGPQEWVDVEALEGRVVRVRNRWTAVDAAGAREGMLEIIDGEARVVLALGEPVLVTTASDGPALLAVSWGLEARSPLTAHVLRSRASAASSVVIPREASASDHFVTAVVATAEPGGFAVLSQEQSDADVTSGAAHTFLTHLAPDGSVRAPPREVAVPWALAAMAWDGRGYTLALYFSGFGAERERGLLRVCAVTLTPDGAPEQHPWWVSAFEPVSAVRMARGEGGVEIYWASGERVRSRVVTAAGTWGSEPPAARAHAGSGAFALATEGGRVRLLR